MDGWYVCNGQTTPDGATPNLLDEKFIMGNGTRGQAGGANTVTLTTEELSSHAHNPTSNPGNFHRHTYNKSMNGGNLVAVAWPWAVEIRALNNGTLYYNTSYAGAHIHTVASAGGDTAHNNMPKYYTVLYIKRLR